MIRSGRKSKRGGVEHRIKPRGHTLQAIESDGNRWKNKREGYEGGRSLVAGYGLSEAESTLGQA